MVIANLLLQRVMGLDSPVPSDLHLRGGDQPAFQRLTTGFLSQCDNKGSMCTDTHIYKINLHLLMANTTRPDLLYNKKLDYYRGP